MEIPYTVAERPDTGVNNVKLGIWLFLASEVMLFGGLFSTYVILRLGGTDWPLGSDILSVPIGTFNTAVLIGSSVTMVMAHASLKMNQFDQFKKYMGLTVLLALVFLTVKSYEYFDKISHGDLPSASTFLAIYWTMTALHGLHIIGGVVVNGYFWGPGSKMFHSRPEMFANRVEAAGLYWHFVDLVWIFLFPVLYLL
ncbi:MAG: hypothetical protein CL483_15395 [Acidobacteria bacterium]|jgi:cytochrome c oxidase subunit 3|nr:hypothetical protein [Acidobacteriota bacterium]|tara:strand:- start:172 stop:762 length:591 start_codon:yes stop_codon:yes gene_type:complete